MRFLTVLRAIVHNRIKHKTAQYHDLIQHTVMLTKTPKSRCRVNINKIHTYSLEIETIFGRE